LSLLFQLREDAVANDLEELVVVHLREMHAQLQGISGRLEGHDRRFDRIEMHLDGHRPIVEHTLSLATLNQLKVGQLEDHRDASAAWQKQVDARLDRIENRLNKVEQKIGL
jgi:hypothetical protein